MELAGLSWKEVEEYLKRRGEVLLPVGSVEEHGYHLPLSTDGDIAVAVCRELGRRTGILVAPVVWYGYSRSTRGYSGTVMVGRSALREYLREVLEGFGESGFRRVFVVSGHFSNDHLRAIEEAALLAGGVEAELLDFSRIDFSDILESEPLHACEAETSLMLFLHPEKVRMHLAKDEEIAYEGEGLRRTESGVFGTPTLASREKGERIFERIVSELERWVVERTG
ncbi:MAG: creatininase family protein [Euryarchaeota archaeon]|nr:creatininase family protein [Euryarchaeota archaeon]